MRLSPYASGLRKLMTGLWLMVASLLVGVIAACFNVFPSSAPYKPLINTVVLVCSLAFVIGVGYRFAALWVVCPKCFKSVFSNLAMFVVAIPPFRTCPKCGNNNTKLPGA